MKNYICLNHGECHWADEIPPREFPLVDGEVNCPNCNSTNIREVVPNKNKFKRLLPLAVAVILIVGLIWKFWPESTSNTTSMGAIKPPKLNEQIPKDTSEVGEEIGRGTTRNSTNTDKNEHRHKGNVSPKVTYHKVAGSEFCIGDCVVEYTEQDNLGHTRVRRIGNYSKCCPADK